MTARELLYARCGPDEEGLYQNQSYYIRYEYGADVWGSILGKKRHLTTLSKEECVALLRGPDSKLAKLKERTTPKIKDQMFFRLSTRSGKDLDGGIRVSSFDEIVRVCRTSERLREDLELHVRWGMGSQTLYLVLEPWMDIQEEYRCFIHNRKLIGVSTMGDDPKEIDCRDFQRKCEWLIDQLSYKNYVIDFALSKGEVVPLEVNPLWPFTDLYAFEACRTVDRTVEDVGVEDCGSTEACEN